MINPITVKIIPISHFLSAQIGLSSPFCELILVMLDPSKEAIMSPFTLEILISPILQTTKAHLLFFPFLNPPHPTVCLRGGSAASALRFKPFRQQRVWHNAYRAELLPCPHLTPQK